MIARQFSLLRPKALKQKCKVHIRLLSLASSSRISCLLRPGRVREPRRGHGPAADLGPVPLLPAAMLEASLLEDRGVPAISSVPAEATDLRETGGSHKVVPAASQG